MRSRHVFTCIVIVIILTTVTGCNVLNMDMTASNEITVSNDTTASPATNSTSLVEDRRIYSRDKADSMIDLYITVQRAGNKPEEFYYLNTEKNDVNAEEHGVEIIIQEGDPSGPQAGKLGFNDRTANALMTIRGSSTRYLKQRNYKIKLFNATGLFRDVSTIDLEKHALDLTHVRNKLSFDLFKNIPDITSLRTQFIHLHVKDLSTDSPKNIFEDYGLYEQVEAPSKTYLKSHGLDVNGALYKARDFEFYQYKDSLKLATDPNYDPNKFNEILQIKGSNDHARLIQMLKEINDINLDINGVVDKFFDRDNLLTWLAATILMGNQDTRSQNFFLYNPSNSQKFYFLPWDYDDGWGRTLTWQGSQYSIPAKFGIQNYWGMILFQRMFKDPGNVQQLSDKVDEIYKTYINKDKAKELLSIYYPALSKFTMNMPDVQDTPVTKEQYDKEWDRITDLPEANRNLYYQNLKKPMPFFLGEPVVTDNKINFNWDSAYDLRGLDITYDFIIATDSNMSSVVSEAKNLKTLEYTINALPRNRYYWKVTAHNSEGGEQVPFDEFIDTNGTNHIGVSEYRAN
jgi:hypothetical protein